MSLRPITDDPKHSQGRLSPELPIRLMQLRRWNVRPAVLRLVTLAVAILLPVLFVAPSQAAAAVTWPDVRCPLTITPPSQTYQDTVHNFEYKTDATGRPMTAFNTADLTKSNPSERGKCQGKVGGYDDPTLDLGKKYGGPRSWDGGHLIRSQFGGVDQRYNLVPQLAEVNQNRLDNGVYFAFEDVANRCLTANAIISTYRVDVTYLNNATVFPKDFHVRMDINNNGSVAFIDAVIPWKPTTDQIKTLRKNFADAINDANC